MPAIKNLADRIAALALPELDKESVAWLRSKPCPIDHHFGIGLWVRNRFIHPGPEIDEEPDELSSLVTNRLSRAVLPEYDEFPLIWDAIGDNLLGTRHNDAIAVLGRTLAPEIARHYELLEQSKQARTGNLAGGT